MKYLSQYLLISILTLLLVGVNSLSLYIVSKNKQPQVLGEDIEISATVYGCVVVMYVRPERREPAENNWGTSVEVDVYRTDNTFVGSFDAVINDTGESNPVHICGEGINAEEGSYNFYVRGYSHLRKLYGEREAFATSASTLDLSTPELIAGDINTTQDNEINSLDLSEQIRTFGTSDMKDDLDQDGIVDSSDMAITIINLYQTGD